MKKINLVNSKTFFLSTIIVIPTIILIVYISGIKEHRSLYLNSLISVTIISIVFFSVIAIGLYRGWKQKDTLGNFFDRLKSLEKPSSTTMDVSGIDGSFFDGDGVEGCVGSILLWIIIGLFGSIILWFLSTFFWAMILLLAGILYWIVFRAFRLIFRNSTKCKGDLTKSIGVALLFTLIYNCWIYAIIFGVHYFKK